MLTKLRLGITLVVLAVLLSSAVAPAAIAASTAYVEPALLVQGPTTVSVIVAATSSQAAGAAVERLGGQVTSDLWLINSVAATLPADKVAALATAPGIESIVANRGVTSSSKKQPYVRPTKDAKYWELTYPVAADVGADALQQQRIDGRGVTVALVDSGVYFDKDVRRELGSIVANHFLGQIDFVASTCQPKGAGNSGKTIGTQYSGYCALTSNDSADGYGHGTAVASVMWNNFVDASSGAKIGIAPRASVLSVRVLNNDGSGSYETVIKGIQYVVQNKAAYNIRVLNLSLSAQATTPYFVDPLNRAAERAWAGGIVVLAAAGNSGPGAQTITVPGNDPYVITVGAINGNGTAGDWSDDSLPYWSATGPTTDGFIKPDVLAPGANVITFMYNGGSADPDTQNLVLTHPDFSETASMFRMSGTSISTAVASGVSALILQAHPELTPDQVKFRLMYSARPALMPDGDLLFNVLQQGMGRIWAPDAVLANVPAASRANAGMDISADLAHGYQTDADLAFHYQGPIYRALSDDGRTYLYYMTDRDGTIVGMGAAQADTMAWLDRDALAGSQLSWNGGQIAWGSRMTWAGGMTWASRMTWAGNTSAGTGSPMTWAEIVNPSATIVSATSWVEQQ